jgi:hypothetical protein
VKVDAIGKVANTRWREQLLSQNLKIYLKVNLDLYYSQLLKSKTTLTGVGNKVCSLECMILLSLPVCQSKLYIFPSILKSNLFKISN